MRANEDVQEDCRKNYTETFSVVFAFTLRKL
jgi:hypothetical protein